MSNRIEDRLPEFRRRIEVLEGFEAAQEARNGGTRAYDEGVERWNERAYEAALEPFERARERYRSIREHVAAAETAAAAFEGMDRPETVDRERLAAYFRTTRTVADLSVDVAGGMHAAAEAMIDGEERRARDRQATVNEALAELRGIDPPTPRNVAGALGLIDETEGIDVEEPDDP